MDETLTLVVFVPEAHADAVRQAMGKAGAGRIGQYSYCSFSSKGTGRFQPGSAAQPASGRVGEINLVSEERIEVYCQASQVPAIVAAIKQVHPYEEVVIDLYPHYKNPA